MPAAAAAAALRALQLAQVALDQAESSVTSDSDRCECWNQVASHVAASVAAVASDAAARQRHSGAIQHLLAFIVHLKSDVLEFIGWQLLSPLATLATLPVAQQLLHHICGCGSARELLLTFPEALECVSNEDDPCLVSAIPLLLSLLTTTLQRLPPNRFRAAKGAFMAIEALMQRWAEFDGIFDSVTALGEKVNVKTPESVELFQSLLLRLLEVDADAPSARRNRQISQLESCGLTLENAIVMTTQAPATTVGLSRFVAHQYESGSVCSRTDARISADSIGSAMLIHVGALLDANELQASVALIQRMCGEIGESLWRPGGGNGGNDALWGVLQRLINALVYHPKKTERRSTLEAVNTLLSVLDAHVRFETTRQLIRSCPYVQVSALILRRVKDELNCAYDEDEGSSPFIGRHVLNLVDDLLHVATLDSVEFIRRLDLITSAVNFYRFVAIRDVRDLTGIASAKLRFEEKIAVPLRQRIQQALSDLPDDAETPSAKDEERGSDFPPPHIARLHIDILQGVLERTSELCQGVST